VSIALAQQHGSNSHSFCRDIADREVNLSDIIDKARDGQHVESAKGAFLVVGMKPRGDKEEVKKN
jgi:hypothetical protein